MDADTKLKMFSVLRGGINLVFSAFIGWAAIDGGPWGQGFAIFIVVLNLRSAAYDVAQIEEAVNKSHAK